MVCFNLDGIRSSDEAPSCCLAKVAVSVWQSAHCRLVCFEAVHAASCREDASSAWQVLQSVSVVHSVSVMDPFAASAYGPAP